MDTFALAKASRSAHSGTRAQIYKRRAFESSVYRKDRLAPAMLNRMLRIAAFQNPEFYKAQAMRLSTYDKPRVIACGDDFPKHIALPRGFPVHTPKGCAAPIPVSPGPPLRNKTTGR